ncbi:creatininase [Ancylobacter sp. 6x-1]|uniref:Creatininase n=1 Tax=Ancylobacter crimeensis TaxID=2579147 RepID=A0ABT0D7G5_9HYPH|nr:creatininase [Ancylobacter crimeensis]MCK0195888.1 creatininase [Ancylobacter crimeensis]
MVDSVFMAELSWPEYQAKIKAGAPVFLSLGATEQHGPHSPLGVDVYLPTAVCERVARQVGGLVAPTLPYGAKSKPRSGGGEAFPGTTSLDVLTLILVVRDIVRALGRDGVKKIIVVIGHFENGWPAVEGIDLAFRDLAREGFDDVKIMRLEYWDFVEPATHHRLYHPKMFPGTELEHASLIETSLMMLVRPDLVEIDKAPDDGPAQFPSYDIWPTPEGFAPRSGVLADARGSTAEKGGWLMDDHVALITAAVKAEFGL